MANINRSSQAIARPDSGKNVWRTPVEIFNLAEYWFGKFDVDACADKSNTKCENFVDHRRDFLTCKFEYANSWMNPPHSNYVCAKRPRTVSVFDFLWRAAELIQCSKPKQFVCLVPADLTTIQYERISNHVYKTYILSPRVAYFHPDAPKKISPMGGSMLVVFRQGKVGNKISVVNWRKAMIDNKYCDKYIDLLK